MLYDTICNTPGLTHYYPLTDQTHADDVVGGLHGLNVGVKFDDHGGHFDGHSYIELPDHADFSATTTGQITIVVFNTIEDWHGAGASEYVHWMGKGAPGAHEWTFRHYVLGGSGEARARTWRTSFYHFNVTGGLGAGSYFQDDDGNNERLIVAQVDATSVCIWKDGALRDTDALSGYDIKPVDSSSPVRLGTRDLQTGFLVGTLRDVAFFNRKLGANEIADIYAARSDHHIGEPGNVNNRLGYIPNRNNFIAAHPEDVMKKHNELVTFLRANGTI